MARVVYESLLEVIHCTTRVTAFTIRAPVSSCRAQPPYLALAPPPPPPSSSPSPPPPPSSPSPSSSPLPPPSSSPPPPPPSSSSPSPSPPPPPPPPPPSSSSSSPSSSPPPSSSPSSSSFFLHLLLLLLLLLIPRPLQCVPRECAVAGSQRKDRSSRAGGHQDRQDQRPARGQQHQRAAGPADRRGEVLRGQPAPVLLPPALLRLEERFEDPRRVLGLVSGRGRGVGGRGGG